MYIYYKLEINGIAYNKGVLYLKCEIQLQGISIGVEL